MQNLPAGGDDIIRVDDNSDVEIHFDVRVVEDSDSDSVQEGAEVTANQRMDDII